MADSDATADSVAAGKDAVADAVPDSDAGVKADSAADANQDSVAEATHDSVCVSTATDEDCASEKAVNESGVSLDSAADAVMVSVGEPVAVSDAAAEVVSAAKETDSVTVWVAVADSNV